MGAVHDMLLQLEPHNLHPFGDVQLISERSTTNDSGIERNAGCVALPHSFFDARLNEQLVEVPV
ncbi:hypothetical protein L915_03166 [Phytophthora nicotianae]|uniref:Uncharacterized protein n=1 Tax=Phytophthora nicotianae TaxID=4792 RepID=W2HGR9_PHYNI|nr:hypothetical protein L915_03166 [Phytophthora nicotianae]ETL47084.1 hypothetical protein L916_03133 [Phytophthora nicotianae]